MLTTFTDNVLTDQLLHYYPLNYSNSKTKSWDLHWGRICHLRMRQGCSKSGENEVGNRVKIKHHCQRNRQEEHLETGHFRETESKSNTTVRGTGRKNIWKQDISGKPSQNQTPLSEEQVGRTSGNRTFQLTHLSCSGDMTCDPYAHWKFYFSVATALKTIYHNQHKTAVQQRWNAMRGRRACLCVIIKVWGVGGGVLWKSVDEQTSVPVTVTHPSTNPARQGLTSAISQWRWQFSKRKWKTLANKPDR